jgi:hypothetical protein
VAYHDIDDTQTIFICRGCSDTFAVSDIYIEKGQGLFDVKNKVQAKLKSDQRFSVFQFTLAQAPKGESLRYVVSIEDMIAKGKSFVSSVSFTNLEELKVEKVKMGDNMKPDNYEEVKQSLQVYKLLISPRGERCYRPNNKNVVLVQSTFNGDLWADYNKGIFFIIKKKSF